MPPKQAQAVRWAVNGANHGGDGEWEVEARRLEKRQFEPPAAPPRPMRREALAPLHVVGPLELITPGPGPPPPSTMSLVNLSHVCSHLQNASLAKLGLTSIPYTQMHLSLSILLQKQGFLSQVKLGGPSPPASCFPPGSLRQQLRIPDDTRDNTRDTEGVPEKLWKHQMKNKEQLEKDGWDSVAANFLMRHEGKASQVLTVEGLSDEEIDMVETHAPILAAARAEVRKWLPDLGPLSGETLQEREHQRVVLEQKRRGLENTRLKSQLLRDGFSTITLQHFAGPKSSLRTMRDIDRDGITISAMGIDIHNQPWKPHPRYGPDDHDDHDDHDAELHQQQRDSPKYWDPKQRDPDELDVEGVVTQANRSTRRLWLGLKYWDGVPVLRKARMLSKPTKRIWLNAQELVGLARGKGAFKEQIKPLTQVGEIMVISTDRGIMEVRECAERRIGGMVLCRIW